MKKKVFGYARVSSKEQNEKRQLEAFKEFNIDERAVTNSVMMYLAYVQEYVNRREAAAKGPKIKDRPFQQESGLRGRFQKYRREREKEKS